MADNFPRADFRPVSQASERPEATGKIISECAGLGESRQGLLACLWNRILHLIQRIMQAVAALDLAFPGEVRDMLARPESECRYRFGRLSPRRGHH